MVSVPLFMFAPDAFPSSLTVFKAFLAYFGFGLPLTFFVEDFVFVPKIIRFNDPLIRTRIFGLFLVILGMVVQLIAAFQDLFAGH